jgi:hypothetical protein
MTFVKYARAAAPAPAILIVLIACLIIPTAAFAHEHRTIASGKYDVTVGWDVEPAYDGLKNGASIRIAQAGSNPPIPVEGAEKTLKVQIRQGATTREFPLRAVFGQKGSYVADIVPTRAGDYQWTFIGTIGEDSVKDTFDTADAKFNKVEAQTALEFPQALPDAAQQTAALNAAVAEAQSARTISFVGAGLGLLGVLAALAVWVARPRPGRPARAIRTVTESA